MTYDYATEKPKLMNPNGIRLCFAIRDQVKGLIQLAGAFCEDKGIRLPNGMGAADSFQLRAALWFLVESEELHAIKTEVGYIFVPGKEWRS